MTDLSLSNGQKTLDLSLWQTTIKNVWKNTSNFAPNQSWLWTRVGFGPSTTRLSPVLRSCSTNNGYLDGNYLRLSVGCSVGYYRAQRATQAKRERRVLRRSNFIAICVASNAERTCMGFVFLPVSGGVYFCDNIYRQFVTPSNRLDGNDLKENERWFLFELN